PTAIRIQPMTSRLTPPTCRCRAKVRIAPTAIRNRLAPMPMTSLLPAETAACPHQVPSRRAVNRIPRRSYTCAKMAGRPREATILHADLDAFYASVEQRDDPALRGRPVIVGGGVVLAASYEAKAYGVRTAMGGRQARQLCPRAVVVAPRMSAYSEASKAVYRVFEQTT